METNEDSSILEIMASLKELLEKNFPEVIHLDEDDEE
jgi:hypothetical protein